MGTNPFPKLGTEIGYKFEVEMSSLKKRGKVWYIKFTRTHEGQTEEVLRSLETGRKEVARDLQKDLDQKIDRNEINPFIPGFSIPKPKKSWYSVQECISDYLKDKSLLAHETLRNHRYVLNKWMDRMGVAETPIKFIKRDQHIKPFFTRSEVKPVTMESELMRFKTFWNWLLEEERVETNEVKPIRLPESNVQYFPKMITRQEFEQMIKAFKKHREESRKESWYRDWMAQDWFVPAISTIFFTGIRLSEAGHKKSNPKSGLRGENIIWDGDEIHFIYINKSKTDHERLVPVTTGLNDILQEYFLIRGKPKPCDYVFLNGYCKPVTARNIYDQFKKFCKLAGISENRTIHGMRHARVTSWIEDGFSMKEASVMAGHKSVETTDRIYSHLAGNVLREKMLKIEKQKSDKKATKTGTD